MRLVISVFCGLFPPPDVCSCIHGVKAQVHLCCSVWESSCGAASFPFKLPQTGDNGNSKSRRVPDPRTRDTRQKFRLETSRTGFGTSFSHAVSAGESFSLTL